MTYKTSTTDSGATSKLAERLAGYLYGSEMIELASDLGGGKTTFVQGLARGLGYAGRVTSPTFTLSQIYALPNGRELHHYDLYRLGEAGVIGDELAEDIGQPQIITIIEWAGIAENVLPVDRLRVEIEATGENDRDFVFRSSGLVSDRLVRELQR